MHQEELPEQTISHSAPGANQTPSSRTEGRSLTIPTEVRVHREGMESFSAVVVEASRNGCRLRLGMALQVGSTAVVEFAQHDLIGEVRHCSDCGAGEFEVGIFIRHFT